MSADLVIEFSANGKPSSTTITAKLGDDVLGVDRFDPAKKKPRDEFIDSVCANRPGIKREHVEKLLMQHAAEQAARQHKVDDEKPDDEAAAKLQKMPQDVRDDALRMLESRDLMKHVLTDVAKIGVAGERDLAAAIYMIGTSRLLPKPLAGIIQAPSSSGKSYVLEKVASLFPKEVVIHATDMTSQTLFYMEPGSLRHKFIVAGERSRKEDDDRAECTRALREMISTGRLSKLVAMKTGSRIVTQRIEQEGPISYVETTTLPTIFAEDLNRCLLLNADERHEQTTKIVKRLAAHYSGATANNVDAIVQRHHAAQRMIQGRQVVIPFAEAIGDQFDCGRIEARRAFPHLMSMIQTSALLHQFQREIDDGGRIVADSFDYELARQLCRGPLARLLGGTISGAALRFYDRLTEWANFDFSTTEACRRDRKSSQNVRGWLRELADAGAVEQHEEARGSRPATWKLTGMDRAELAAGDCGLPETIDVHSGAK
jgi:hypothetical protein